MEHVLSFLEDFDIYLATFAGQLFMASENKEMQLKQKNITYFQNSATVEKYKMFWN